MHTKCEPRSWLCCFLGYGVEQKGCRCYDLVPLHLCISCHVVFWEHQLFHEAGKFSIVPFLLLPHSLRLLFLLLPLMMSCQNLSRSSNTHLRLLTLLCLCPQVMFHLRILVTLYHLTFTYPPK